MTTRGGGDGFAVHGGDYEVAESAAGNGDEVSGDGGFAVVGE